MRERLSAIAGLAGAFALLGSRQLLAGPPSFELSWSAPVGCPDQAHVRSAIEHLAGPGDASSESSLVARATATRSVDGRWHLHLETERAGNHGERDITGESCEALAGSAAVILALVLNPAADLGAFNASDLAPAQSNKTSVERSTDVQPGGAPPTTVAASPSADAPKAARPLSAPYDAVGPRRTTRWFGAVLGALDVGALPEPAWGVTGVIGARFGRARVQAPFTWWSPQHRVAVPERGVGGDFSFISGAVVGCYDLTVLRLAAGPCAGLELGAIRAVAFGVRIPGDAREIWVAAMLGGSALLEVTPALGVSLGVFAGMPFRQPDFVLEGVGSVHQPRRFFGRASLGAALQF